MFKWVCDMYKIVQKMENISMMDTRVAYELSGEDPLFWALPFLLYFAGLKLIFEAESFKSTKSTADL